MLKLKDFTAADNWGVVSVAGMQRQVSLILTDSSLKLSQVAGYVYISVGVFLGKTPNLISSYLCINTKVK